MGWRMGQSIDAAQVENRASLCVQVFDQARRVEERRLAVATLATRPCERSVNRRLDLVKDESLKNEAALAAVDPAGAMFRTDRQAAQELAKKILDMNVSADINERAEAIVNGGGMRGMRGMRGGWRAP